MADIPQPDYLATSGHKPGGTTIPMRDLAQVIVVMLLWALCYPLITTGLSSSPPIYLAAMRSLLAGASLLAVGILYRHPLLPDRDTWLTLVVIALTFTTIGFTGMFLAGELVTPGLATVIANTQPLLAALLGYFVLPERVTRAKGLALLVGFAGIVVIAIPGLQGQASNSTLAGIIFVLLGASGVAIGNVLLKRIASQIDPLIAMAWILLLGAIPLIAAAAIFEQTAAIKWNMASVVNLFVLSVFGTALAFVLWLDVLRRAELILLNTYTFLTPVFALLIGMLFYAERLTYVEWLGVAVILVSILLASRRHGAVPGAGNAQ